ncbi:uncharacterized protein DNG_04526 [Cephalotrichum gorgonifer]|uniref:Uncharacterized protein n=1 Tax=Cephalotrichum gorgonifer TaxID=2041049 RepID=A0AAE8MYP6_9PEZI|nr:uncharacterized protein DNG_04526 [Cephalotrichum gorgonifer]
MANRQHVFFYAPTWDYPPGGPIKLGNVITSVKSPQRPLHYVPPPEDPEAGVFSTTKTSVQYTKEKLRAGKFSILTNDEETFTFETVETTQFIPTPSYLQQSIDGEHVRRFLQMSRYRKPIYIITGLKIVTGAQANTVKSRTVGGALAVEVDATVWSGGAVPIGGGPGVERRVSNKGTTKWGGSDDFVFAYRVSEVFVGKTMGRVVSEEEYRKGAMLGDEAQEVMGPELHVLRVEDPNSEVEGFDTEELLEDGDVVLCAIPKEDDIDD